MNREEQIANAEKATVDSIREQRFAVRRADREDIKRILAVYYEQNVTTERFEDFDGERWIIPDD